MARSIYCRKCGANWHLTPEDGDRGIRARKVFLAVDKERFSEQVAGGDYLYCDNCGDKIQSGEIAIAVTSRHVDQPVIGGWEHLYGEVIPDSAMPLADTLAKE